VKKAAICAILLVCSVLFGCQSESVSVPELLEPAGVKSDTATVQKGDLKKVSIYNGETVPYVEILEFSFDGRFDSYLVDLGDTVEEGQVLAQLNDEAVQDAIEAMEEAIADVKRAGEYQDRQTNADIEIAKATLLAMQESEATAEACEVQKKEIAILEEQLEQARQLRNLDLQKKYAQLAKLNEEANQLRIVAPFAGTVVHLQIINTGDWVRGFTPVMCIADENKIWISAEEISAYEIEHAYEVAAQIDGKNYNITHYPYEAGEFLSMTTAGAKIDTRFTIDNPADSLECGQYVQIKIVKDQKKNVLTMPINALYEDESGTYVYKEQDGERARCEVEIGFVSDVAVEILSGLEEGETVYVKE